MADHLEKIKSVYRLVLRGQGTPELSYRPHIHEFLSKMMKANAPDADVIHEPASQLQKGHPDWLFYHSESLGVYGYTESKGLEPRSSLDWRQHQEQICRYLSLGHKLALTDGVDFFLFGSRQGEPEHIMLAEKPLDARSEWSPAATAPAVRSFFSDFFREPAPRCVTDAGLVADLAVRAKNLAEDIESLVRLRPDEGINAAETRAIGALRSIKETLTGEYDASLSSDERFSKAVSQILVFGAFYAHRHLHGPKKPSDLRKQLAEFWTSEITTDSENRLKPFRALAGILGKDGRPLDAINSVYSECMLYLSYVKLSNDQQERPNYHKLYETFLEQFDPRDRIDFGAYATPSELARFMIGLAEHMSRSVFGRSIFMSNNKIIEPCCGTGTFLEEILREAAARGVGVRDFPAVAGFEILAAPYALSQYRLYQLKERYPLASRVRSLLCNTLSDRITNSSTIPKAPAGQRTLFDDEIREAAEAATPPITLVIGNPPSSDADRRLGISQNAISELMEDFRPPAQERRGRQNVQKQMQNDFVKFLRWACHKVESDEYGIVAFILPSAFLQHRSYEFARKWIFHNFSRVWVVEFDKDARTGAATSNIFHTMQGRCMLFCSRETDKGKAVIRYASVTDLSADEKMTRLKSLLERAVRSRDLEGVFLNVEPTADSVGGNYAFKPATPYDGRLYSAFWNLTGADPKNHIFQRHSSGVKLGMTSALTHLDKGQLSRRIRDMGDTSKTYADLTERWFRGQAKPPPESSMSGEIRSSIRKVSADPQGHIKRYSFRPFVNAFAFLHEDTLQKAERSGGGGTRRRPEVLAAFSKNDNPGISVAPSPVDLGAGIQRFSSFCWHVPDNDLCARGNGHVFCSTFPKSGPSGGKSGRSGSNRNNINPLLEEALRASGIGSESLGTGVVFYVYAVLSSKFYLKRFEGALYSTGRWPKIPMFGGATFAELSSLGRQIAECEEAHVEPARGSKILPNDGIRLKRYEINIPDGTITLHDNGRQRYVLDGFKHPCLEHTISGYSVFGEYLKRNKWAYLRRNFTNDDVHKLYMLNETLSRQLELIRQADRLIESALGTQELIIPPTAE